MFIMLLPAQLHTRINACYLPWLVCFSAALFFFYEFIQMHMFNSISAQLMEEFHLNAANLGYLSATYLFADVIFLMPAGLLLDRFSTRNIILIALSLCIMGTVVFALSQNVWLAAAAHFFAGIGNAFCFLSCMRLASRWFPARRMALITGLIVTIAMAGGIVAQAPLTWLSAIIGWRDALLLNGMLGVIIFILIWLFVQDCPISYQVTQRQQQQQLQVLGFWQSFFQALHNKQNWYCGLYTSLLNLPIMLLCALWGNLYLTQVHHITTLQASYAVTGIFIGTIIGCPLVGWWSDYLEQRKLPMIIGAILSLITVSLLLAKSDATYLQLLMLFALLGFFTSAQVLGYPVIAESNPAILTSTATGIASVIIMGGAALFQPVFGAIMDQHWLGMISDGLRVYPEHAYQLAMLLLPIAFLIALIIGLLLRETHCRRIPD